jgi:predicted permease
MPSERWLRTLPLKIRSLFRRGAVEQELDEEIRDHIECQTAANISAGMPARDARTAALREFGGVERRKEESRDTRGVTFIEQCVQDLTYAIRGLRRSPGFTLATVLTLGLGIGVSSAAFSLLNRVVLHPLPFAAGDRLVLAYMHSARSDIYMAPELDAIGVWQRSAKTIDAMAVIGPDAYLLTDSTHAFSATGKDVSPELFSMLGIVPLAGRNLLPSDTVDGAPRVAMLGETAWRREFGARADVVGRTVFLNDTLVTIVGVVPVQLNALTFYQGVGVWTPTAAGRTLTTRRNASGMHLLARLRPGVSDSDAQRELQDLYDRMQRDAGRPARTASSNVVRLTRPNDFLTADLHGGLWIVFGATALVLLIACANVVNLQLVRTARRAGELAIRRALGASSARLARQFVIESAVLISLGAVAGAVLGAWILRIVVATRPEQLRQLSVVRFDWTAAGFAVLAAAISSVVFAVAPVWRQGTAALADGLRMSGAHSSARTRRLQPAIVTAEIALSLVLLTSAGLLMRSFVLLQRADPGYVADGLVEFGVSLRGSHFPDSLARAEFWRRFVPTVKSLPGVVEVSVPVSLPTEPGLMEAPSVEVEGHAFAPGEGHFWLQEWAYSAGDFRVLQNRILQGRVFNAEDERGETDAAVIAESAAQFLWPGESAIGRHLRHPGTGKWLAIVGVVADQGVVTGPIRDASSLQLFLPTAETRMHRRRGMLVRVVAGARAETVLANMTAALHTLDRTIPITIAKTELTVMHDAQARPRFTTTILAIFAALALFLAAVGLYGVISYAVSQRVREIGVRMALGAESSDVVRLVLGNGARLALAGALIGVVISLGASRVMRGMLYGISPLDPLVFAAMPLMLLVVALFATYIPARRAARADPVIALRADG